MIEIVDNASTIVIFTSDSMFTIHFKSDFWGIFKAIWERPFCFLEDFDCFFFVNIVKRTKDGKHSISNIKLLKPHEESFITFLVRDLDGSVCGRLKKDGEEKDANKCWIEPHWLFILNIKIWRIFKSMYLNYWENE